MIFNIKLYNQSPHSKNIYSVQHKGQLIIYHIGTHKCIKATMTKKKALDSPL